MEVKWTLWGVDAGIHGTTVVGILVVGTPADETLAVDTPAVDTLDVGADLMLMSNSVLEMFHFG